MLSTSVVLRAPIDSAITVLGWLLIAELLFMVAGVALPLLLLLLLHDADELEDSIAGLFPGVFARKACIWERPKDDDEFRE